MRQEVITKTLNPYMIILARESRELTQSELAKRLHITQGHLSKIENGLLEISEKLLHDLSRIMQYPAQFFLNPSPVYPPSVAFYYKYKSLPKKVQNKICALTNICRLHIEHLLLSIDIERHTLPNCDLDEYETPENIAGHFACGRRRSAAVFAADSKT